MYKIRVNDQFNFEVASAKEGTLVNSRLLKPDITVIKPGSFHILHNNRSYNAELLDINRSEKSCTVRVNTNVYSMLLTDQFDELLHQLGMDNLSALKVSDLKAPMPGMVLKVLVAEGEEVKKGGNLLVLEAMKMENIIKSPADVMIKSIKVTAGDKVEKNQVIMVFN